MPQLRPHTRRDTSRKWHTSRKWGTSWKW